MRCAGLAVIVLLAGCANATSPATAGDAIARAAGKVAEWSSAIPRNTHQAYVPPALPDDVVKRKTCGPEHFYQERCSVGQACFYERDDGGRFECKDDLCMDGTPPYLDVWCARVQGKGGPASGR